MPRIGPLEIVIILVIILVIFGVGRLPEVGGGIGKGLREFRSQLKGDGSDDSDDETTESKT
ncbi:MAG: twin-arginine translocase TatA/TatE family subunit [Chloroflexi bacterium]|nr:twin-arginine translocase TatA/TatE family subunit [Chloroflexota bacterium]